MKLLSLAAFVAVSSAFLIPNGTGNGIYIHHHHNNGSHTHIRLAQALDTGIVRRTVASAKFKRLEHDPNGWDDWWAEFWNHDLRNWVHCGNLHGRHYKFNQSEVDGAKALFRQGCNSNLDLGNDPNDFYVVNGDVVMFMCNWAQNGQWCRNDELDTSLEKIKDFCNDDYEISTGKCLSLEYHCAWTAR
jgi:hypothetical protein